MKAVRVAGVVLGVLMMGANLAWGQCPSGVDRPEISVSGSASVNVKPDKITVRFGVETMDPDIVASKNKNNQIVQNALAAILGLGIERKEIQTDHLSIEPRHQNHKQGDVYTYVTRNAFAVEVNDPAKVEALITVALQNGVTNIHGIEFETTELKKHRERARELALLAAKEKAEKMSAVLGRGIGAPVSICESGWGGGFNSGWHGGRSGAMVQNVQQAGPTGSDDSGADTIALGMIAIQAHVQVVFELKE